MADYRLSEAAAADLEAIALYGFEVFGDAQTRRYQEGLKHRLQRIADSPLLFER